MAMSRFLLWLSGADQDVLSHCERERAKFVAMGGTVITTSVFATAAATFTINRYLHAPLALSIVVGILWGLAIMNLDRWLLISIRRQATPLRTVTMAIPRVVLAVLIGILIAEPLVLRVFESEVTTQAARDKRDERSEARQEVKRQYAAIPKLEAREQELQDDVTSVDSGAALEESPAYRQASANLRRLEKRAANARHAALCELDGRCGTTKRGYGPAYEAKNEIAQQLGSQVATAKGRLDTLASRLLKQEGRRGRRARNFDRRELEQVRSELRTLRGQRRQDIRDLRQDFSARIGLLDRIEALGNLTSEHPSMLWLRLVLFLCILAIDTLPAVAKVLMSLGEPSLYERVQSALEKADVDALERQAQAYAEANQVDAEILVAEATARRAAIADVQDDLVAQAVDGMRVAGERFVSAWTDAVNESVDDLVDEELRRTGLRLDPDRTNEDDGRSNGSSGGEGAPSS